jgi:hypothetical protein
VRDTCGGVLLALLVHLEEELEGHAGLHEETADLEQHLAVAHAGDLALGEVDGRAGDLLEVGDEAVVVRVRVRDEDALDGLDEVAGRGDGEDERVLGRAGVDAGVDEGEWLGLDEVGVDGADGIGRGHRDAPHRQHGLVHVATLVAPWCRAGALSRT